MKAPIFQGCFFVNTKFKKCFTPTSILGLRFQSSDPDGQEPVPLAIDKVSPPIKHPFLIAHGLLGSKTNWKTMSKGISRDTNRRTIAFDLRNHGSSPHVSTMTYSAMKEDILLLANTLGIKKFSLMGHSLGGRAVMNFALKYPQYIEKLIVIDVTPYNELQGDAAGVMQGYINALLSIKFDPEWSYSEARKFAAEILRDLQVNDIVMMFLMGNLAHDAGNHNCYWKPNLKALADNIGNNFGGIDPALFQTPFKGPTLFIRGGKSNYVPDATWPRTNASFPQAELVTLPESGHWPQVECPELFRNTVVNFLNALM